MTFGLWVFITVVVVNVLGLLVDLYLILEDLPTITELAKQHVWFEIAIVFVEIAGILGLVSHFRG